MTDAELLAHFPRAVLEEVAAVLRHGQAKHGAPSPSETGGGQRVIDHLMHAHGHVALAVASTRAGRPSIDHATGHADTIHAIARLILARGLELDGEGAEGMR